MRLHRGAVSVDSEVGKGTTFRVLLPVDEQEMHALLPDVISTGSLVGTRRAVLVIDDEPDVLAGIGKSLDRLGFEAVLAIGGKAGIEAFQANADAICCTIVDLTMPEMSGEQVFETISRVWPGSRIVVMSGHDESEVLPRFPSRRPQGFLQKPFRFAELRDVVEKVLES